MGTGGQGIGHGLESCDSVIWQRRLEDGPEYTHRASGVDEANECFTEQDSHDLRRECILENTPRAPGTSFSLLDTRCFGNKPHVHQVHLVLAEILSGFRYLLRLDFYLNWSETERYTESNGIKAKAQPSLLPQKKR